MDERMSTETEETRSDAAAELASVALSEEAPEENDLNLRVRLHRTTSLMGPSGSGKTVILKTLAGLLEPAAGVVRVLGQTLQSLSERQEIDLRKRVGYVFQDAALWQNMDVFQNIALPLRYHRLCPNEEALRERVHRLAQEFGIAHYLTRRPANVPFGVRKTVSFLRALAPEPELLFVDEPSAFLDTTGADRIISALRQMKDDNRTVVTATSDPRITAQLADDLVVLKDAQVLEEGPVAAVVRSSNPQVAEILSDVLSETATYAGDILDLLDPEQDPFA
jgi:phospholipid/cholesterol/gamma-HCH transport system ATP-binding protein